MAAFFKALFPLLAAALEGTPYGASPLSAEQAHDEAAGGDWLQWEATRHNRSERRLASRLSINVLLGDPCAVPAASAAPLPLATADLGPASVRRPLRGPLLCTLTRRQRRFSAPWFVALPVLGAALADGAPTRPCGRTWMTMPRELFRGVLGRAWTDHLHEVWLVVLPPLHWCTSEVPACRPSRCPAWLRPRLLRWP